MTSFFIPQRDIHFPPKVNFFFGIVAAISIWSMLILVVLVDLSASLYQAVFFSIMKIPKIPRKKYVRLHRHRLKKVAWTQKISCAYCEYTNGVIAWCKALANQTEKYSCAIKYQHQYPGQGYQAEFYDPKDFE